MLAPNAVAMIAVARKLGLILIGLTPCSSLKIVPSRSRTTLITCVAVNCQQSGQVVEIHVLVAVEIAVLASRLAC